MVKKTGKWFEDENIQRITVKGKNIYWKKYILEEKEKANLVIQIEKKSKDMELVGQRKKNTVRAAKLQYKKCSILSRAK